jgi:hypothetical protein
VQAEHGEGKALLVKCGCTTPTQSSKQQGKLEKEEEK